MKLYMYQGLESETVPKELTHMIVKDSVTIIKGGAFEWCDQLVFVIMVDNVKRIEDGAFYGCRALRSIRLSKTLFIGYDAFNRCYSLVALFLPSTVKLIEYGAFCSCSWLKLLILPNGINVSNIGNLIIYRTNILEIAEAACVTYTIDWLVLEVTGHRYASDESSHQVNEWLFHHIDELPFHKLCYNPSVTTKQINDHLNENGNDSTLQINRVHGVTPLQMLAMNPHAPAGTIAALFDCDMEAFFCLDNSQKNPLEY